ncbi:MAG: Uma2 family endonuclease [Anaerolineae bacterium]|nr:Uma2 family endonuclease [Anaerolineae bacterium]
MMVVREKLYTIEEFLELAQAPENATRRLELADGVIVEMPPSSRLNTITAGRLIHFLNAFVIPRDLGYITVPDGGYQLGPNTYRQPDAAFIARARSVDLDGVVFETAPDLAIEVVSPGEDILKKAYEYLLAGTQIVWAVYAEDKLIRVLRLDENGDLHSKQYGVEDILDGGEVLPGFKLAVRDVFPS